MTFDDYLEKQDHILIEYWDKPNKRVLSLDEIDLRDVWNITYLKYDAKKDGLLWHRENGPACIIYDKYGRVKKTLWYKNNKLHRLTGPTVIFYKNSGTGFLR